MFNQSILIMFLPYPGGRGGGGGGSSEARIRVYMIAPVRKFGRARLNTDFLINEHGGDFM